MTLVRVVLLVLFSAISGWAAYQSYLGVGGASGDTVKSFRERSVGGPVVGGRVK